MKICFFNSCKVWGGGEKWHFETSKLMKENGHDVVICGHKNSELALKAEKNFINFNKVNISNLTFFNILKMINLIKYFKKERFDVIILNLPSDLKSAGIAAKIAGIKKIIYRRGMPHPIKGNFLNKFLFKKIINLVIANSLEIKKSINLFTKIFPEEKIEVLYNGMNFVEKKEKIVDECIIFGNAGRLTHQKGQICLIKAARYLKEKGYNFKIVIAGKGELETYLNDKIKENGVEKFVEIYGFIEKMDDFFHEIDIFSFPSYFEGSSNAMVEALAYGKPIVCFNTSSMPEMVQNNLNGFLAEYENQDDFNFCMEKFILNKKLLKLMGEESYKIFLEKFTIEKMVSKLNDILKK